MKQGLEQEGKQLLTFQQRQGLQLLSLPLTDLQAYLQDKLQENPALEWHQPREYKVAAAADDAEPWWEKQPGTTSIYQHLQEQINCIDFNAVQQRLALWLLDNLNSDGFHQRDPYRLLPQKFWPLLTAVLAKLQQLDPVGCFSSNSLASMRIQAAALAELPAFTVELLEPRWFNILASGDRAVICRHFKITAEVLEKTVCRMKRYLQPYPAREYRHQPLSYPVPELWLSCANGQPLLQYRNPLFSQPILSYPIAGQPMSFEWRQAQIEARQLLRGLEYRQQTLLQLGQLLLQLQPDFILYGLVGLRALTAVEVAYRLGCHPSTVSRALAGKYIQTPYGILPLHYFCSAGVKRNGIKVARIAVKYELAAMLRDNPNQSDAALCQQLQQRGYSLVRRTVTKYRHELLLNPEL